MKKFILLLVLCPLLSIGQIKKDTIYQNDIYSEFPVGGIPAIQGKGSRIVMDCGMPASRSTTSILIKMNCGGTMPVEFQPLYVVNDCVAENFTLTSFKPGDIESINILKDASAIKKYGIRAKNGVIEITLKNNSKAPALTPIPKP